MLGGSNNVGCFITVFSRQDEGLFSKKLVENNSVTTGHLLVSSADSRTQKCQQLLPPSKSIFFKSLDVKENNLGKEFS